VMEAVAVAEKAVTRGEAIVPHVRKAGRQRRRVRPSIPISTRPQTISPFEAAPASRL